MTEIKNIALKDLHNNTGFELESGRVNANPRVIRDAQYKNLLQSLRESNMTDIMPLKVFEHDGKYVVIGGNMRLRALRELKAESVDCILIPQTYTADMLNKAIIIDNSTHGDWDMDMLANEWNADLLSVWGIDLPEYKEEEQGAGSEQEQAEDVKINNSEVIIASVSLFGQTDETIVCEQLQPEDAERLLRLVKEQGASVLLKRLLQ